MKYSDENKRKHLILMCRYYDGTGIDVYQKKLEEHSINKDNLPPPECMKDEYTLSDEEVMRLKAASCAAAYEECWVNERLNGSAENIDKDRTGEYIAYGNKDFEADDGTPISLKALLWNRYFHWGGCLSDQESFYNWYRTRYSCEPTNREKRAAQRRPGLIAKCRYYHGEEKNPWDFNLCTGNNRWRKTYWNLEKSWVDELSMSFNSSHANHDFLKKLGVEDFFKEEDIPLSLAAYILSYHNHVAEQSLDEIDGKSAILSYSESYLKLIPLGDSMERYFNFFAGEDENPWNLNSRNKNGLLWMLEHKLYANKHIQQIMLKLTEEAIQDINEGWMKDDTIPLEFKAIWFYVEAMVGKWMPYDNLEETKKAYLQGIDLSSKETPSKKLECAVFGISRLRMNTDGKGITTLVAFMGCPLKCKYCLNEKCHQSIYEDNKDRLRKGVQLVTPQSLYDIVKQDNIYFQATNGGICFGGGEPTMNVEFIREFARLCKGLWRITLETALPCTCKDIEELADIVDEWIVDVKDMNSHIYKQYTGNNTGILQKLYYLKTVVPIEKITIKVPHIPDYNNDDDVKASVAELQEFGFTNIQEVHYTKSITHITQ